MTAKQLLPSLKSAFAGAFAQGGLLLWFIAAALIAPIALVSLGGHGPNNVPWPFWVFGLSVMVAVIGAGLWKFARKRRDADNYSISPDRRRGDS